MERSFDRRSFSRRIRNFEKGKTSWRSQADSAEVASVLTQEAAALPSEAVDGC